MKFFVKTEMITPNKSFTRGGHKGQLTLPPAFLRKSASRKMMRAWGIISLGAAVLVQVQP